MYNEDSLHQDKYSDKSFEEMLFYSKDLVDKVYKYFVKQLANSNALIRPEDDVVPYFYKGKRIRLADINLLIDGQPFYVECKDFAACLFYAATGLPKSYVEKLIGKYKDSSRLLFLFRENPKYITVYTKKHNLSREQVVQKLIERKAMQIDKKSGKETKAS